MAALVKGLHLKKTIELRRRINSMGMDSGFQPGYCKYWIPHRVPANYFPVVCSRARTDRWANFINDTATNRRIDIGAIRLLCVLFPEHTSHGGRGRDEQRRTAGGAGEGGGDANYGHAHDGRATQRVARGGSTTGTSDSSTCGARALTKTIRRNGTQWRCSCPTWRGSRSKCGGTSSTSTGSVGRCCRADRTIPGAIFAQRLAKEVGY